MCKQFDVVVIGGGVVGLSAALGMRQHGFSVALLDAGSLTVDTNQKDVRVYAINRASSQLLQQLDVWNLLDPNRISPYTHMHVWDSTTDAAIDFDARLIGQAQLGYIIEEVLLKQALLQKVQQSGVVCFPQRRVHDLQETNDGMHITCNAESWHAKLLIAADGANSNTREQLGVNLTTWPYHQDALVATVHTAKSNQQTAFQVFNTDGSLAFLPLSDANQCSIVWSVTPAHAKKLKTMDSKQFNHVITKSFANTLGPVEVISERFTFPLTMRHTHRYASNHWLLMGDAAHTIHPLAGLGLNIGLEDVADWLKFVDSNSLKTFKPKQLAAYQRKRKHAVWQMIALMEGLKTIFASPLPPIAALRGFGLKICNQLPLLKLYFIKQAAGSH